MDQVLSNIKKSCHVGVPIIFATCCLININLVLICLQGHIIGDIFFSLFKDFLEKTNSFTENYHCSVPRAQASPNVPEGNAFFVNISTTTMAVGRKTGCIKSWCDELWVWPVWSVRHSDRFVRISFGKYLVRFRQ